MCVGHAGDRFKMPSAISTALRLVLLQCTTVIGSWPFGGVDPGGGATGTGYNSSKQINDSRWQNNTISGTILTSVQYLNDVPESGDKLTQGHSIFIRDDAALSLENGNWHDYYDVSTATPNDEYGIQYPSASVLQPTPLVSYSSLSSFSAAKTPSVTANESATRFTFDTWSITTGELIFRLVGACLCICIILATIVGNVLVIIVVARFHRMRTVTNILLAR